MRITSKQWARAPADCPTCRRAQSLAWRAIMEKDGPHDWVYTWELRCHDCQPIADLEFPTWAIITEVHGDTVQRLIMWHANGTTIPADIVAEVAHAFAMLRILRGESMPAEPWGLEADEDGNLRAGWDPTSPYRHGSPVVYRRSRAGRTKRERECASCREPINEGDSIWRPGQTASARPSKFGWSTNGFRDALVCAPCGAEALTRGQAASGRMVGHLKVLGGDDAEAS